MIPEFLQPYWQKLPPWAATFIGHVVSLLTGLLVAFVLYYLLYRVGLPSKPFIYVVF
jgi:hypothetical protein